MYTQRFPSGSSHKKITKTRNSVFHEKICQRNKLKSLWARFGHKKLNCFCVVTHYSCRIGLTTGVYTGVGTTKSSTCCVEIHGKKESNLFL